MDKASSSTPCRTDGSKPIRPAPDHFTVVVDSVASSDGHPLTSSENRFEAPGEDRRPHSRASGRMTKGSFKADNGSLRRSTTKYSELDALGRFVADDVDAVESTAQRAAGLCKECVCLQIEALPRVNCMWVFLTALLLTFCFLMVWFYPTISIMVAGDRTLHKVVCPVGDSNVTVTLVSKVSLDRFHMNCSATRLDPARGGRSDRSTLAGLVLQEAERMPKGATPSLEVQLVSVFYQYLVHGLKYLVQVDLVLYGKKDSSARLVYPKEVSFGSRESRISPAPCVETLRLTKSSIPTGLESFLIPPISGFRTFECAA